MFARSSRDCWVWWMVVIFWVREEREEERDCTEVWVEESFERCADSSFCWSSSLKVRSRKLEWDKNDVEGREERKAIEAPNREESKEWGSKRGIGVPGKGIGTVFSTPHQPAKQNLRPP